MEVCVYRSHAASVSIDVAYISHDKVTYLNAMSFFFLILDSNSYVSSSFLFLQNVEEFFSIMLIYLLRTGLFRDVDYLTKKLTSTAKKSQQRR
jgi:hypothetical protein